MDSLASSSLVSNNEFKVVAWNVNGLRNFWRKRRLTSFLIKYRPDCLILLELKSLFARILAEPGLISCFEDLGYVFRLFHTCERPQSGYSGVGVFCRLAAVPSHCFVGMESPEFDEEGRVVTLIYPSFIVIGVYVVNSGIGFDAERDGRRSRFDVSFQRHLCRLRDWLLLPLVVVGDFNVAPRTCDVFDGATNPVRSTWGSFKPQERRRWLGLLAALDLEDLWLKREHTLNRKYTFYFTSRHYRQDKGWRLDTALVSKGYPELITDFQVLEMGRSSDHLPILVGLQCPFNSVDSDSAGFCFTRIAPPLLPIRTTCSFSLVGWPTSIAFPLLRFLSLRGEVRLTVAFPFQAAVGPWQQVLRAFGFKDVIVVDLEASQGSDRLPWVILGASVPEVARLRKAVGNSRVCCVALDLPVFRKVVRDADHSYYITQSCNGDEFMVAWLVFGRQPLRVGRFLSNLPRLPVRLPALVPMPPLPDEFVRPQSDGTVLGASLAQNSVKVRGVPLVPVFLGGSSTPISAMIDSGASYCVVTEAAARHLLGGRYSTCFVPAGPSAPHFQGIGSVRALGSLTLHVSIGKYRKYRLRVVHRFWVIRSISLPLPILIGSDLLVANHCIIDYSRSRLMWPAASSGVVGHYFTPFKLNGFAPRIPAGNSSNFGRSRQLTLLNSVVVPASSTLVVSAVVPSRLGFTAAVAEPLPLASAPSCLVARGLVSWTDDLKVGLLVCNPLLHDVELGTGIPLAELTSLSEDKDSDATCGLACLLCRKGLGCVGVESDVVDRAVTPPDRVRAKTPVSCTLGAASGDCSHVSNEHDSHYVESRLADVTLDDEGLPSDLVLDLDQMNITPSQLVELKAVIRRHSKVFTRKYGQPGRSVDYEACIDTGSSKPVAVPLRRVSPKERDYIGKTLLEMEAADVIEPSSSPWSAAIVLVPKKDGKLRFAIDYRRLNSVTVGDVYPLPRIDDTLASLGGCKYFSSFDMDSGFWNIPVAASDRPKTAFNSPHGQWQFKRMPFGLKNAPGVFQRYMDLVLAGVKWQCALVFIDDVLVFSRTWQEHLKHLDHVLSLIDKAGLRLKGKKCLFCRKLLLYLGHVISARGLQPNPDKIRAISAFRFPTSVSELRRFLGMVGYYRRFVKNFAVLATPLTNLLKSSSPLAKRKPTPREMEAFKKLKDVLCSDAVLSHPDFSLPFEVHTDACSDGLGAVLCQKTSEGLERVICFLSRKTRESERKYHQHDLETLAVVWSLQTLRPYLVGREFIVKTDRTSVKHVMDSPESGRQIRWVMALQGYTFKIEHRSGRTNKVCDALSRSPLNSDLKGHVPTELLAAGVGFCGSLSLRHDASLACVYDDDDMIDIASEPWLLSVLCPSRATRLFIERQASDDLCKKLKDKESSRFVVVDGLLWLSDNRSRDLRLVVPSSLVRSVIHQVHGLPLTGHLGVRRTHKLLKAKYYWPGMKRIISDFVAACVPCSSRKTPRPLRSGLSQSSYSSELALPFARLFMDLTGPFELSSGGSRFVLCLICGFTKWPVCVAIPDKSGETIAEAIYNYVISLHGVPRVIHSDCAPEFISGVVSYLQNRWGIVGTKTSGEQPQANGQVERFFRFFKAQLAIALHEFDTDWETSIPAILFSYRVSVNSVTGFSPYFLVYGRDPVLPHDLMIMQPQTEEKSVSDPHAYVTRLKTILTRTYDTVRSRQLAVARRLYTAARDLRERRHSVCYSLNDLVLLWEPQHFSRKAKRSSKLCYRWSGPWRVVDTLVAQPNNYLIEWVEQRVLRSRGRRVVNVNRMTPFVTWDDGPSISSTDVAGFEGDDSASLLRPESVRVGALVIVKLTDPDALCVAEIVELDETVANMKVHWMGNSTNNMKSYHVKGWLTNSGNYYYKNTRKHSLHKPYVSEWLAVECGHAFGFPLLSNGKLPAFVLRFVSSLLQ